MPYYQESSAILGKGTNQLLESSAAYEKIVVLRIGSFFIRQRVIAAADEGKTLSKSHACQYQRVVPEGTEPPPE
jgi:hypothetical protein